LRAVTYRPEPASRAPASQPASAMHGTEYRTPLAWMIVAAALTVLFVVVTAFRVSGSLTHLDLRIVAHLVPAQSHPHLLSLIHPLVHLGDAAAVGLIVVAGMAGLWLLGYRHTWAMLAVLLSWPIELGCKSVLPQPAELGSIQASVSLRSLVHGAGTATLESWLHHTAPAGVQALAGRAGGITLNLISGYPSGTTARGTFVVGFLIWLCLRLDVPVISELTALLLLAPLSVLGLAMVLYAWHWPSEVLGGYILGFGLLALTLALLHRPAAGRSRRIASPGTQGPHSPLPCIMSHR
jgi:PAP2 superfamily